MTTSMGTREGSERVSFVIRDVPKLRFGDAVAPHPCGAQAKILAESPVPAPRLREVPERAQL
ncbi:MAG: hypothetical protein WCL50_03890 [Spirochaetota bacterium]